MKFFSQIFHILRLYCYHSLAISNLSNSTMLSLYSTAATIIRESYKGVSKPAQKHPNSVWETDSVCQNQKFSSFRAIYSMVCKSLGICPGTYSCSFFNFNFFILGKCYSAFLVSCSVQSMLIV